MTKGIAQQLDIELRPLGFVRNEVSWNRSRNGLVDVISLQLSKDGRRLTVEAGVLEPAAFTSVWEKAVPTFVETPECTIRARIGELVDNHDRWWALDQADLLQQLSEATRSYLLPFLDRHNTADAIESWLARSGPVRYLTAPETVYLVALKHSRGDIEGACALLRKFEQKVLGAWKGRAASMRARIDCG